MTRLSSLLKALRSWDKIILETSVNWLELSKIPDLRYWSCSPSLKQQFAIMVLDIFRCFENKGRWGGLKKSKWGYIIYTPMDITYHQTAPCISPCHKKVLVLVKMLFYTLQPSKTRDCLHFGWLYSVKEHFLIG